MCRKNGKVRYACRRSHNKNHPDSARNMANMAITSKPEATGSTEHHALPAMLVNIQFLRFVAAMLVVLYHSSAHLQATGLDQGLLFDIFEAVGFAGVDVFFVISGFIMAYTTTNEHGLDDGIGFFKRRVARIYSGYWPFYLLAIAVFAWVGGSYLDDVAFWNSLILWPGGKPLIAVSWTLIYEMFFYISFTLLIFFTASKRRLLLILLLLAIIGWSVYSHFVRHAYDEGHLVFMSLAEAYMASPYLAEFLGGALLAGWLARRQSGWSWSWLIAGSLLFLAGGWINIQFFDGRIEQGYFVFWRVLVFGTASLMIVAGLVRLELAGATTALRFSLAAGGASYAIYLSHILFLTASQHLGFNGFLGQFSSWVAQLAFLLYAAGILFYCIAHYRVVEKPLHRLFKRGLRV
jgi:peptidoglycan/LPS O-acetylase OafA/YrhL